MKYLLDTNICIYIIKKKPAGIFKKFQSLKINDVAISSITLAELEYGVYKCSQPEKNKIALTKFIAPILILPFEENASRAFGEIRANLQKKGQPIGLFNTIGCVQMKRKEFNLFMVWRIIPPSNELATLVLPMKGVFMLAIQKQIISNM